MLFLLRFSIRHFSIYPKSLDLPPAMSLLNFFSLRTVLQPLRMLRPPIIMKLFFEFFPSFVRLLLLALNLRPSPRLLLLFLLPVP
jgi:hypothetical protein